VSRRVVWILAVLLGVTGAVIVWVGLRGQHGATPPAPISNVARHSVPTRPADPSGNSASGDKAPHRRNGGVPDPIAGRILPASKPVAIAVPRLGITSSLVHLGVDSTGAMEVPSDPSKAGWYTLGPTPGELGPAVIAGHVTWNQVPAVFFRLGDLRPGDRMTVTRRDGLTAVFTVGKVRRFPKVRFPTKAVFGTVDYAGLRLITCGGTYDSANHRYLDNIVVFARLVSVHATTR
jgi:hypothetical protein